MQEFGSLIGIEMEGFVYDDEGVAVDVYEYLGGGGTGGMRIIEGVGQITTDAGRNQLEIAPSPSETIEELFGKMMALIADLPQEWQKIWTPEDPYWKGEGLEAQWTPKPRHHAVWQAEPLEDILSVPRQLLERVV